MDPRNSRKRIDQLRLPGMGRGGRRKGAGRPPKGARALTSRAKRPRVTRHDPLMITVKVRKDIPNLRNRKTLALLRDVLRGVRSFEGFRVVHYSLQRDHIHMIVEGDSTEAISRGMQSLLIRFGQAINRMLGRKGPVLADRYHAEEIMKSPREMMDKLGEALGVGRELDRFSSAAVFPGWTELARDEMRDVEDQDVVSAPMSWRLAKGWKKYGPICPRFVPGRKQSKRRARQPRKMLERSRADPIPAKSNDTAAASRSPVGSPPGHDEPAIRRAERSGPWPEAKRAKRSALRRARRATS